MVLYYTAYGMLCAYWGYKNAEWSNPEDKWKIKHWFNGLCHLIAASLAAYLFGWYHFFGVLCLARLVFNTTMNLVRKLNPFYVSPSPKSFIDRMEKKVFGSNGWIPFLVYLKTLIVIFFFG